MNKTANKVEFIMKTMQHSRIHSLVYDLCVGGGEAPAVLDCRRHRGPPALLCTMSSVVEVVTAECQAIKVKQQLFQKTLDDDYDIILDQAKEIVEKRSVYGEEATRELLKSCEETMRLLVQAQAQHKAQFQALQVVPTRLSNSSSPADVEKAYASATAELISSEEEQSNNEKYKRLREIIDKAEGCSDAGPSQADDMGDDGFAMTQATRSLKCDLLVVEMTLTGEHRPMKGPCGHVFSYKGLQGTLKNKTMKCPKMGCNQQVCFSDFVEAKDVIKEIKQALRLRET